MTEITLTLKVKGVEIELSTKDAKELYEALGNLVGSKGPIVIERDRYQHYPWWPYYLTWCSGIKTTVVGSSSLPPKREMWTSDVGSLTFSVKG